MTEEMTLSGMGDCRTQRREEGIWQGYIDAVLYRLLAALNGASVLVYETPPFAYSAFS